jgi:hypothetical protein
VGSSIPREDPSHSLPNISLELSVGLVVGDSVSTQPQGNPGPSAMAYQRADPRSFVPPGLQMINIPHREMMARAVVHRVPRAHEDYGIVSLNPLPLNAPMNFPAVQDVLFEFFEEHLNVQVRECQPSHLGHTLVRFENAHKRDLLVTQSPFQFGDVQVSVVRHNEGRN